jgi:hypothetical protein
MRLIESVYIDKTYGGILEGCLDLNKLIDRRRKFLEKMYGNHVPFFFLEQEQSLQSKSWCHSILLCDDNLTQNNNEPDAHGSHLIVTYFAPTPLFDVNFDISNDDWNRYAKNFYY